MAYSPAVEGTRHFSPDWGADLRETDLKSEGSASPAPSLELLGRDDQGEAQLGFRDPSNLSVRGPARSFEDAMQAARSAEALWDEMTAELSDSANRWTCIGKAAAARHLERLWKIRFTTLASLQASTPVMMPLSGQPPIGAPVPVMVPPAAPPPPELSNQALLGLIGHVPVPVMVPPSEPPPTQLLPQASHGLFGHAPVPVMVPPAEPPPAFSRQASCGLLGPASVPVMAPPSEPPPLELFQQASLGFIARAPVPVIVPPLETPPELTQQAPHGLLRRAPVLPAAPPPEAELMPPPHMSPGMAKRIAPWNTPWRKKKR